MHARNALVLFIVGIVQLQRSESIYCDKSTHGIEQFSTYENEMHYLVTPKET